MSDHEEEHNSAEDDDISADDSEVSLSDEDDLSSDEEGGPSAQAIVPEEDVDEIEQQKDVPNSIEFNDLISDICCHPKRNIVAVGTLSGPVHLYTYSTEEGNKKVLTFEHHAKNSRVVRFSSSGDHLFTGANDGMINIIDLQTNSLFRNFSRDNGSPLYSILPIDDYLLASGEDDGQVVLWDFRMQAPVECFEDCEDYISSLVVNNEKKVLLATSGDGILSAYNIRGKKLIVQSEEFDCDLLCSGIFKKGSKVVVGASDGSLNIFNWDEFGSISDRFPGHPEAVDSMVVLSNDVICTGCEDGKIRAVQLFPNRFLGVLGTHNGFSVEKLSLTYDKQFLASSSHDQMVKFWDLSGIEDLKEEDVKDTKQKHRQLNKEVNDFFADL